MSQEKKERFSMTRVASTTLIAVLRPLSVPTEMLLHFRVGERYLGFTGLLAFALLYAVGEDCPSAESAPLGLFMMLFTGRVIVYLMANSSKRDLIGPPVHSRDPGRPFLSLLNSRWAVKKVLEVEPVLVIGIGALVGMATGPLGAFLMWSGGATLISNGLRESLAHNRLLDRVDARLEQQAEDLELNKRLHPFERYEVKPLPFVTDAAYVTQESAQTVSN